MNSTRKTWSAALGCAVALASMFLAQPASAGGAGATCRNWSMSGRGPLGGPNIMNAECKNFAQQWVSTSIWLPGILANMNGNLVYARDGYYDRSCSTLGLVSGYMVTSCRNNAGQSVPIQWSVDNLSNQNGVLAP